MKPLFFFSIILIMATFGCTKKECDEALTTVNFTVGKSYCLNDNQSITIDSIADWRCPKDVECISAGETRLYMNMFDNDFGNEFTFTIPNSGDVFEVKDNFGYDYSIKAISPYPTTDSKNKQEDYIVEMTIVKSK